MKAFVSTQAGMSELVKMVHAQAKFANSTPRVLVLGCNGCGKTHLAAELSKVMNVDFLIGDQLSIRESGPINGHLTSKWVLDVRSFTDRIALARDGYVMDFSGDNISEFSSAFNVVIIPFLTNPDVLRHIWDLKVAYLMPHNPARAKLLQKRIEWSDTRIMSYQWQKAGIYARLLPHVRQIILSRIDIEESDVLYGWWESSVSEIILW